MGSEGFLDLSRFKVEWSKFSFHVMEISCITKEMSNESSSFWLFDINHMHCWVNKDFLTDSLKTFIHWFTPLEFPPTELHNKLIDTECLADFNYSLFSLCVKSFKYLLYQFGSKCISHPLELMVLFSTLLSERHLILLPSLSNKIPPMH